MPDDPLNFENLSQLGQLGYVGMEQQAQAQPQPLGLLQMAQAAMDGGQASNDGTVPGWVTGDGGIPQWAPGQREDWTDNTKWPGLTRTKPGDFADWQYEPGTYIRGGQIISPAKFYQDTHRPVDTQEGGGIVGGSLLPYRGFNNANAWSTKGQVGYFGQTGPWGTSWGAGGP